MPAGNPAHALPLAKPPCSSVIGGEMGALQAQELVPLRGPTASQKEPRAEPVRKSTASPLRRCKPVPALAACAWPIIGSDGGRIRRRCAAMAAPHSNRDCRLANLRLAASPCRSVRQRGLDGGELRRGVGVGLVGLAGAAIPIARVAGVAFDLVQYGMDPAGGGVLLVL